METLSHAYHVYASGSWREPVEEHMQALYQSGLINHLDSMYVGYVGTSEQIAEAEAYIVERYPAKTLARRKSGWEQETMKLINDTIRNGVVLYAHTKGASDPSLINIAWRRSMTKHCILNWRACLSHLTSHDTVGCHWLMAEDGKRFYGGTFWWANSSYLQTLPPVPEENRWQAEHWIGLNPDVRPYDLMPGIHPGQIPLNTDWRNE